MIKPKQIPDEAWQAARLELVDGPLREDMEDRYRHALAAAINAWRGMMTERRARCDAVVLPYNLDADLPQEASDA